MVKPITREMLENMTVKQRMVLYQHARATASSEADDIIEKLFQHHLLDSAGGGLPRSHITIQKVEAICRSPEGVDAAVKAATNGEAPMAGVDPMLQTSVREYGHFDTTSWAGGFVAEEMEELGWVRRGRKVLPAHCIAKNAASFDAPADD